MSEGLSATKVGKDLSEHAKHHRERRDRLLSETNPNAPRGPAYVPEYRQPELAKANVLDEQADDSFAVGASDGETADHYVRTTVFLAVVLFLVGNSAHFPLRAARYALIAVGAVLLVVSLVLLAQLPRPPA